MELVLFYGLRLKGSVDRFSDALCSGREFVLRWGPAAQPTTFVGVMLEPVGHKGPVPAVPICGLGLRVDSQEHRQKLLAFNRWWASEAARPLHDCAEGVADAFVMVAPSPERFSSVKLASAA